MGAVFTAIFEQSEISGEWKELLLLLLGAFIGSYGKIIDYWFSDTDKDKMLVQKMDEEDGVVLSNTMDLKSPTPVIEATPDTSMDNNIPSSSENNKQRGVEVDEDNDGVMDGIDEDGDGTIDMYFDHRQCDHVWGDENHDGEEECLKCGLIKEK